MSISRRHFTGLTAFWVVSACAPQVPPSGPQSPAQSREEPGLRATRNPGFDAWLVGFRARAAGQGIGAAVLDRALARAGYLPGVLERDRTQTEFRRTLEDNIALATSDERIRVGKVMLTRHKALFAGIESRYRVEAPVVAAIWGHESIYGQRRGNIPVVSSLATLAYAGRRRDFFAGQLVAALKIIQAGEVSAGNMVGSWAGAMGHTQFIPTTYLSHAVDYTGDGRRDVWGDDPADALASAASYLKRAGWRHGQPWGIEVRRSDGRDMQGRVVPDYGGAQIVTPAGQSGPAFKLFHNYKVLRRYNNALSYAISVGHLADRLAGGGPFQTPFAPDPQGLSLADRKDMQRRLAAAGFDPGGLDGVIGPKTIAAIRAYQRANGLTVDGVASRALLAHLRT
ncbi:MAG TPA: lytic murein transglycosylase [Aliiroseovarius sp.]|nr:lytic murein transglycosylase [Aliiroseovarius sp.]